MMVGTAVIALVERRIMTMIMKIRWRRVSSFQIVVVVAVAVVIVLVVSLLQPEAGGV
jgi:nitrate/nitrite transporter NarK